MKLPSLKEVRISRLKIKADKLLYAAKPEWKKDVEDLIYLLIDSVEILNKRVRTLETGKLNGLKLKANSVRVALDYACEHFNCDRSELTYEILGTDDMGRLKIIFYHTGSSEAIADVFLS